MPIRRDNSGKYEVVGISGLSDNERKEYIDNGIKSGIFKSNASLEEIDINYQLDELLNRYDKSYLKENVKNNDDIKRLYRDAMIQDGFDEKFGIDEIGPNLNLDEYNRLNKKLTTEGKLDLLNSDWKTESEIKEIENIGSNLAKESRSNQYIDSPFFEEQAENNYPENTKEHSDKVLQDVISRDYERKVSTLSPEIEQIVNSIKLETQNGGIQYTPEESDWYKNTLIKSTLEQAPSKNELKPYTGQYEKIISGGMGSTSRVLDGEGRQKAIQDYWASTVENLKDTPENRIDWLFRDISASSNYYNAFENTPHIRNLTLDDKIRYIAEFFAMNSNFDGNEAFENLDLQFRKHIADDMPFIERAGNVMNNVLVGGVANLMNKVIYAESVGKQIGILTSSGEEKALREQKFNDWLNGKDENGELLSNWDNPQYWNGVDQYNTLDALEIDRANHNGGVSQYNNVYKPDEELRVWSRQTLDEAIKMGKFLWSDYIIGQLTGGANKWLAGLGKVGGVAGAVGVGLTAAFNAGGIAQAYGIQTYNQTLDELRQQLVTDGLEYAKRTSGTDDSNNVEFQRAFNEYTQDQNRLNAIENAARTAYVTDSLIEELRMTAANLSYKKWLLGKDNTTVMFDDGIAPFKEVAGKMALKYNSELPLAGYYLGQKIFGGFWSNYWDDVTVGFGSGVGKGAYQGFVNRYDNPDDYATVHDGYTINFLDGINYGFKSAGDALLDKQSWYDGFIGGIGGLFGFIPNFTTDVTTTRDRSTRGGRAIESIVQHIDNPLTVSIREARTAQANTKTMIDAANKVLKDNDRVLSDMSGYVASMFPKDRAQKGMKELKDDKTYRAFVVAKMLANAQSDRVLSQSSRLTNAINELNDLASGNIPSSIIDEFLADKDNETIANNPNSREVAAGLIQGNAKDLLDMINSYKDKINRFSKSTNGRAMSDDLKDELTYMLTMGDTWKQRINDIEQTISGHASPVDSQLSFSSQAEYGSRSGWERRIKVQNEFLDEIQKRIDEQDKIIKEKDEKLKGMSDAKPEDVIKVRYEKRIAEIRKESYSNRLDAEKETLEKIKDDGNAFVNEKGKPVEFTGLMTENEILGLSPKQRAWVLDPMHRNDFSKRQQRIIEQTIAHGKERSEDFEQLVQDSATLSERMDGVRVAFDNMANNPAEASFYIRQQKAQNELKRTSAFRQRQKEKIFEFIDSASTNEERLLRGRNGINGSGVSTEILQEYIEQHQKKGSSLKGLLEMSKFSDDISGVAKDVIPNEQRRINALQTVKNMFDVSSNLKELVANLEEILTDESLNDSDVQVIREDINALLNRAQELGYQRGATKSKASMKNSKKQREEKRKQLLDIAKKETGSKEGIKETRKEEPKDNGKSSQQNLGRKQADVDDAETPRPEVSADDVSTEGVIPAPTIEDYVGPEVVYDPEAETRPIQDGTAFVVTDDGLTTYTPSVVDEVPTTPKPTSVVDVDSGETDYQAYTEPDPTSDLVGNTMYEYDADALRFDKIGKEQVKRKGAVEGDSMNEYFEFLSSHGMRVQDIIDREFGRIIDKHPDTKIHFMVTNPNIEEGVPVAEHVGKDGKKHEMYIFNVVEFTPEIERLHNKDLGGVVEANGKRWLIVGTTGFSSRIDPTTGKKVYDSNQLNNFNLIKDKIKQSSGQYFSSKEGEKQLYYVSQAYTNVKTIKPGSITKRLSTDQSTEMRSIGQILEDSVRNPMGLQYEDLKFIIQEKTKAVTIGISNEKYYLPSAIDRNSGAVFLMVRGANNVLVPVRLNTKRLNEIDRTTRFGRNIDNLLTMITSRDFNERNAALGELRKLLVFDDNNRITIGDEKNNTITVRFNGGEPVRFNLNSNEFSQTDFFQEVTNADFKINYSRNNLLLQERFKMMDEAGCFQTDIAYLGTINAAYYTYPVGSDGRPIIEQKEVRTEPVQNQQSQINGRENTYVINGQHYRESDKGLFDERSNLVTDESIRTSFYYNKIITESGLTPAYTEPKSRNRYYIISNDDNSPLVVKLDRKNNVTVATVEQSRQMIDRIREIKERAARERAINEYDTTTVEPGTERIEANEILGVTEEDVLNMALGDVVAYRENPTGEQQPAQPSQEPVAVNNQSNKAPIEIGSKDTQERLRRVSGTFVGVSRNAEFRDSFKTVIDAKSWGKELTGKSLAEIANILQSHGIETTNIKDAQAWLENIRDCK